MMKHHGQVRIVILGLLAGALIVAAGRSQEPAGETSADKRAADEKESKRTLAVFYSRRAYPGAPPVIPHPLSEDNTMEGRSCLGCHLSGVYVPSFKAYAPVTPHPDWLNCRQCHVNGKQQEPFRSSTWTKIEGPVINREAGAPPPIPHDLQLRTNCLACHAGSGAVNEIRTPHPEREDCRVCHVTGEKAFGENR
jgi:cytochrome c-type protein NapB